MYTKATRSKVSFVQSKIASLLVAEFMNYNVVEISGHTLESSQT
jgi:hypothetical protein